MRDLPLVEAANREIELQRQRIAGLNRKLNAADARIQELQKLEMAVRHFVADSETSDEHEYPWTLRDALDELDGAEWTVKR